MADYKNTPHLYDLAAENTSLDRDYLNIDNFEQQKRMISQSQPVQEFYSADEYGPSYATGLAYYDLYPDQPMFVDGILHTGDTTGVSPEKIITADELRSRNYTVYEFSFEMFDQLMEDVDNRVIVYEEVFHHYISNYQ